MPIGTAFDTAVPGVGAGGTGYAADVSDILQEIVDRLSVKVPVSSIAAADADLDMNSAASVINALGLTLATLLAAPSGAPFGRLARYGGNLYYVDASGAVQITDGNQLNASGIGGISGDFGGGNSAAVVYVDGNGQYEFYEDPATTDWASIKVDFVDIVGSGAFRTRLDSQATVDHTVSLPPDNPAGGRSLLSISNGGNVDHDQTISNSPTLSADLIFTGAAKVQHGNKTKQYNAISTVLRDTSGSPKTEAGTVNISAFGATFFATTAGGGATFYVSLDGLEVGTRITSISARLNRPAAGTARVRLYRVTEAGTVTAIGVEGTTAATGDVAVTQSAINHTVLANNNYMALITLPNDVDLYRSFAVTYDQPA